MKVPTVVTLGSVELDSIGPSVSASSFMVRNFRRVKGLPFRPFLSCRKITGPLPENLIRIARMINTGRVIIIVINDNIISEILLIAFCHGVKLLIRTERLLNWFPGLAGLISEGDGFNQMILSTKNKG